MQEILDGHTLLLGRYFDQRDHTLSQQAKLLLGCIRTLETGGYRCPMGIHEAHYDSESKHDKVGFRNLHMRD